MAESDAPYAGPQRRDVIVVGTSSGGLDALRDLAAKLPAELPAAVCVVIHMGARGGWHLPAILDRAGPLEALAARDGMALERGRIYLAPPDLHLLIEPERLRTVRGPTENRHRPAIDPLFRSAAWAYGPRVVGVLLTGNLDDGTAGLWAVKTCGGLTIVQDPREAAYPEMPRNALLHTEIDHVLDVESIARVLAEACSQPVEASVAKRPAALGEEVDLTAHPEKTARVARLGTLSPFTCPACRGALWELAEGQHLHYRCHVGHAFAQDTLLAEQDIAIEQSLYVALRAVQEKAAALHKLAERWPDRPAGIKFDYAGRARELEQSADLLRSMLAGDLSRRSAR